MNSQAKSGLKLALLLVGILVLFAAINWYRNRFVRSDEDLLHLLPGGDTSVFYARIGILRQAGILALLGTPAKKSQDPDYQEFVHNTQFDYTKDLDVIAGCIKDDAVLLAVKGRFDWNRIQHYVYSNSGSCAEDTCHLRGSSPGTWISVVRIQSNVLGLALGRAKSLSSAIHPRQQAMAPPLPAEPAWVKLAPSLVKNPAVLPVALRIFAISVQPASSVIVALGSPAPGRPDAFEIKLYAECRSAAAADTIRRQLEIETKMLKLELAHEHEQPNPADLTGLLTSGTFELNGKKVTGEWPVAKELLKTLQQ